MKIKFIILLFLVSSLVEASVVTSFTMTTNTPAAILTPALDSSLLVNGAKQVTPLVLSTNFDLSHSTNSTHGYGAGLLQLSQTGGTNWINVSLGTNQWGRIAISTNGW